TDPHELFAESFAALYYGQPELREIPYVQAVRALLDRALAGSASVQRAVEEMARATPAAAPPATPEARAEAGLAKGAKATLEELKAVAVELGMKPQGAKYEQTQRIREELVRRGIYGEAATAPQQRFIRKADVDAWTANNGEGVPSVAYHAVVS